MAKLLIPIDREGYSLEEADDGTYQSLQGGIGRSRLDLQEASYIATVKWSVGPANFETLNQFYLTNEHLAFDIDLIVEYHTVEEYVAYFIPETFSLDLVNGNEYQVSAKLEVLPDPANSVLDEYYLDLFD